MALIDGYVRALFDQSGDAIGIAVGHPVTSVPGPARKPITSGPLDDKGVKAILDELVPAEQQATLDKSGVVDVPFATPQGPVRVNVKKHGASVRMMILRPGV